MTKFGSRLRELRIEKGLSQHGLALELKFGQSSISDWESGKVDAPATVIVAVADYFDVSADYLLGRKEF